MVDIDTKHVTCRGGLPAFIAVPSGGEKPPLVILMHERYGFVKHTGDLAQRLARDGFACISPDFFFRHPDQDALHRGDVGYNLSDPEAIESLDAAVAQMREDGRVDMERIAVIGVCQTGRYPLVYAADHPLSAAIAWYGAASKREWTVTKDFPEGLEDRIARLKCPVLGLFGERDHVISIEDVVTLRNALEKHGKSYTIEIIGKAPHGWLNDTMPGRYRRDEAEAAWAVQKQFLNDVFNPGRDTSRIIQSYKADISPDYDYSKNVRLE